MFIIDHRLIILKIVQSITHIVQVAQSHLDHLLRCHRVIDQVHLHHALRSVLAVGDQLVEQVQEDVDKVKNQKWGNISGFLFITFYTLR